MELRKNNTKFTAKRFVLNIHRMTIHNGPGIRTLILFKGCPLRCLWCSTPESQREQPEIAVFPDKCIQCGKCVSACSLNAIQITPESIKINRLLCNNCGECARACYAGAVKLLGQAMTVEELVDEAKRDMVFYKHSGGGVTLSGGEPLLNHCFTGKLLHALRDEGISIGVDTCGYVPWETLEPMLPFIDFFLWDIKHMDAEKHKRLTGVSNELILSNARFVAARNIPIYIRIPLIPGFNDSAENIRAACRFAQTISSLVAIDIMPLHHLGKARYKSLDRDYPLPDSLTVPDGTLQQLQQLIQSYGIKCNIIAF